MSCGNKKTLCHWRSGGAQPVASDSNAVLKQTGLAYVYGRVRVRDSETAAFLCRAAEEGYAGFNATMPHKTDLVELVDELDADAQLYRAVNTVVLRDGKIRGCNTDGRGFLQMLLEAGISPEGKTITVLGPAARHGPWC